MRSSYGLSYFPSKVNKLAFYLKELNRSYSSSFFGNVGEPGVGVPAASSGSEVDVGSDWVGKFKDAWQCAVDAATFTGQKAKETSTEQSPYIQQLLDSNPHLRNVVVPVGCTLQTTLICSGIMVAPTTITAQYLAPAWRGAVILSFVWFLHRWKTNVFTHALATQSLPGLDRDKLPAMDNISSVGLFVIGIMALAEACGVAVQSIMTVGGIGAASPLMEADEVMELYDSFWFEIRIFKKQLVSSNPSNFEEQPDHEIEENPENPGVATAFAARDILGNVLSGLSMQFSKPSSLGDTIKSKGELHSTEEEIIASAQIIKEHGAKLGGTYQDITSQ
ncbi:hypothetical protein C1H46_032536 [Malus baccata]|uniref:Uncharacterized protein n=1 Tax=Malus baccata TaxID=106549 RepID=A0A540L5Z9_MALBA|nr:hypothetical protein C1H46_032536 [Malus baccata]